MKTEEMAAAVALAQPRIKVLIKRFHGQKATEDVIARASEEAAEIVADCFGPDVRSEAKVDQEGLLTVNVLYQLDGLPPVLE